MVITKASHSKLRELWRLRFNLPWCTEQSPKWHSNGLYLLIQKDPNDHRQHRIQTILLFDIEANLHKKHFGRHSIKNPEELEGLVPEQYDIRESKAAENQALNTRLVYALIWLNRLPDTSIFTDMVSNYDLVLHSIPPFSLQRVDIPEEPIVFTMNTPQ